MDSITQLLLLQSQNEHLLIWTSLVKASRGLRFQPEECLQTQIYERTAHLCERKT